MWDAHINVLTPAAIEAGERRRITSFEDLEQLVADGLVTNAPANAGDPSDFVAGLKPSKTIINCPVIAQPSEAAIPDAAMSPPTTGGESPLTLFGLGTLMAAAGATLVIRRARYPTRPIVTTP